MQGYKNIPIKLWDIFNYNEIVVRRKRRENIPQGCGPYGLNRKTAGDTNEINVCVYQGRMEKT